MYNQQGMYNQAPQAFPPFMQKIIKEGGLINYINAKEN
jgi:hypothetical protein